MKKDGAFRVAVIVMLTLVVFELMTLSNYCRKFIPTSIDTGNEVIQSAGYLHVPLDKQYLDAVAPAKHETDEVSNQVKEIESEKIPLFVITPSARPSLLSKGIFHMLPLCECFDLHWIIVHSAADEGISNDPLFRDIFPWITEIFAFNEKSISGNHERNVAIEHITSVASTGLIYFLDDDNTLPTDICKVAKSLSPEKMYFADQNHCDAHRLSVNRIMRELKCIKGECPVVQLVHRVDSATFLTPVSQIKKHKIMWSLENYDADGIFFTDIVNAILHEDGNERRFEQLSSVSFRYNELNDEKGCVQWRLPLYTMFLTLSVLVVILGLGLAEFGLQIKC